MDTENFKRLAESAKQMKAIQEGALAGRTTVRRGKAPTVKTAIAEIRMELGWSQEEFAKSLNTP